MSEEDEVVHLEPLDTSNELAFGPEVVWSEAAKLREAIRGTYTCIEEED